MLPKKNRLVNLKNYDLLKEKGRLVQSKSFGLLLLKRDDLEASRIGFIVSTRISKKAVERNRLKRSLRDAMRVFVSSLKPGYDLAFLAKKSILDKDRKTIEEEVRIGLTEADLLMENND